MPEVTVDGSVRLPALCLSCGNEAGIEWVPKVARPRLVGGFPIGALLLLIVGVVAIQLALGDGAAAWSGSWMFLVLVVFTRSVVGRRPDRTLAIPLCETCRHDATRTSRWKTAAAIPLIVAGTMLLQTSWFGKNSDFGPSTAILAVGIVLAVIASKVAARSKYHFAFSHVDETFVLEIRDERVAERVRAAAAKSGSPMELA